MNKLFAIIGREFNERIRMRSFWAMAIIGPCLILGFLLLTFLINGSERNNLKILISDPELITDAYIVQDTNSSITYEFVNDYVPASEFNTDSKWQKYDALLQLNEKVLTNNKVLFLYRKHPGTGNINRIRVEVERRLDELKIKEFTNLDVQKYRQIKTPLSFSSRSVETLENTREKQLAGYVGIFFAVVIFAFILMYGTQVMRGVREEKMNRIVEVLVSSVKPFQVMLGKIVGIGFAGLVQFVLWSAIIGVGLYLIRVNIFPDILIPENLVQVQMTDGVARDVFQNQLAQGSSYNDFVNLVYQGVDFGQMIVVFMVFFIFGYLLYASIFAVIGASITTENESQQYVIPVLVPLILALIACFIIIDNPEGQLSFWFSLFPFTSPLVVMVRACMGYGPTAFGEVWEFYFAIGALVLTSVLVMWLASRIYRKGIMNYGKKASLSQMLRWLKK